MIAKCALFARPECCWRNAYDALRSTIIETSTSKMFSNIGAPEYNLVDSAYDLAFFQTISPIFLGLGQSLSYNVVITTYI